MIFDDLVDVIGIHDAELLCSVLGGCVLCVPLPGNSGGELIEHVIGSESLKKLAKQFGGEQITIPRLFTAAGENRNLKISAARKAGASLNVLAIAFNLTTRQIMTICNDPSHSV